MALWLTVGLWIKCSMFEPWLGSLHCIAGQDFTFTLPHSNQVYKWGKFEATGVPPPPTPGKKDKQNGSKSANNV